MPQYVDNYSNNRSDITPVDQDTVIATNKNEKLSSTSMSMSTTPSKKMVKLTMFNRFLGQFDPFNFIFNMGIGISSTLLYSFPYPAHWLEICSYIMFAVNVLLFLFQQFMFFLHFIYFSKNYSTKQYFDKYFRNLTKSVFWGTYPMGLVTIVNYIYLLGNYFYTEGKIVVAKRIFRLVYILWWYDIIVSMFIAWGITFLIWQNYYFQDGLGKWNFKFEKVAAEHLKSILLLAVIPLVVGSSSVSIFIMSDLATITLNRNIQLLTMVIATLLWLHAIIFVFILVGIYFWSLYIFKIPPMSQVFTMFLVLGPMGQGAYGILLLTDNVLLYTQEYYSKDPTNILLLSVPWSFKVLGLILSMSLLSMGYFFTFITLLAIISYSKKNYAGVKGENTRIYHFHQGFWGMTFPMGTMSLGSGQIYTQYNEYVPMGAFRVIGTIYGAVAILWSIFCFSNTLILYGKRSYNALTRPAQYVPESSEIKLEPIVSRAQPETDFSFMREGETEDEESLIDDLERQQTITNARLFGRSRSHTMGLTISSQDRSNMHTLSQSANSMNRTSTAPPLLST